MARKEFTAENVAWVAAHPHLAVAAANLRGQAGMSERAIYETLKVELAEKDRPSYRDLRAAFAEFQAKHLTIAGDRQRRISFKDRQVEEGHSAYRDRRKAQFSPNQVERLNRKTVVGYLIQTETPPEEFANPQAYIYWTEHQSYDVTPPF